MRLVPTNYIKDGSQLAKSIYDENGRVLLAKGCKLTDSILRRLEKKGVFSLYINDGYSDNEIEDLIKPELKQKAIVTLKDSFNGIMRQHYDSKKNPDGAISKQDVKMKYKNLDSISKMAEDIVDEIMSQRNIVINLVDIKSLDNYTLEHCINVAVLSTILGLELKYDKKTLVDLAVGAFIHDIGKVFVPQDILQKNGKLTDGEYESVKKHTVAGYNYVKDDYNISILSRNIILQHHEKIDGTGYPEGIKGNKFHELVKIVSIADVYDALTSDRPYRRALSPNEAMEYIMGAGDRHFDLKMVNSFTKKIIPYPVGTLVKLSNGDVGVILETNADFPLRPKIKIIKTNKLMDIDLMKESSIVIQGVQYVAP